MFLYKKPTPRGTTEALEIKLNKLHIFLYQMNLFFFTTIIGITTPIVFTFLKHQNFFSIIQNHKKNYGDNFLSFGNICFKINSNSSLQKFVSF